MAKTLETIVKERKKQAKKKKIYEKTTAIATYLGSPRGYGYRDHGWVLLVNDVLSRGDFVASYRHFVSSYSEHEKSSAEVRFKSSIVFSESIHYGEFMFIRDRSLDAYVPGDWESELDLLYEEAQKEAARVRTCPDEAELKRRFGL